MKRSTSRLEGIVSLSRTGWALRMPSISLGPAMACGHDLASDHALDERSPSGRIAMDAWYQCENPYPFVPQEVLDSVD